MKGILLKNQSEISRLKKQLKVCKQRSRRLKYKVSSLKTVVKVLRKKQLISNSCEELLNQTLCGASLDIMKSITSGKFGKGQKYPPELKYFALTLQFYSTKAYRFVRNTFNLALPHPAQIRRWYSTIQAEPGFTEPAFLALKAKVQEAERDGRKVVCSLMIDEMTIKKHVSWDGCKFRGYVDIGNGIHDDSNPVAKDALVFMVVCINGSWKVPCAYFFIEGLSGTERANLVKVCIQRLSDTGIKVVSLTCDGPSCHFSMLSELGASMKLPNLQPSFPHPSNEDEKVHILLDVCHMLKLVRNTIAEGSIIIDADGNKIKWQYLEHLQKLQDTEGLRLGNKLRLAHIQWWQQKMKVNLATQALSSSVADAIEYCSDILQLRQFHGCKATVKFIRIFDQLFDILNSRNPFARGSKIALRKANKYSWDPFLTTANQYILSLKDSSGQLLYTSRRKTGFIGFLAAIQSTRKLFEDLVESPQAPLKYLLMYKFSQDHLELFFGAIRSAGGFNNNPTAQQFTAAYKRLLLRSSIQGGDGNCIKQDPTSILYIEGDSPQVSNAAVTLTNAALVRKYDLQQRNPMNLDQDYADIPNILTLPEYKKAAISYISGYVAKMAEKQLLCKECCTALGSRLHPVKSKFLALKDRGGLYKPTSSVIKVCEETEKCFGRMLAATAGKLPQCTGILGAIATAVLGGLNLQTVFRELDSHMMDSPVDENHVYSLIKTISKCYCKIRLHHLGKETTQKMTGLKIRKKLSKLVLFKHQ